MIANMPNDAIRNSTTWRRSSLCKSDGGNCVEVNFGDAGNVGVRKSTQVRARSRVLVFGEHEWSHFMVMTRRGDYDR